MKIVVVNSFPENPSNPARTDMVTGTIEINKESFELLPDYTQRFVLYHEAAHYLLGTYDECKCDDYALRKMAFKSEYSLKHHIDSVYMMAKDDHRRKKHALKSVLVLMANKGDKNAIEMLKKNK